MNSADFIKNLTSDNTAEMVCRCFDEIMVLYNLVGDRQDLDICTDNNSSTPVKFILMMDSENEAKMLYERLNSYDFEVYGVRYIIDMNLSGASIDTRITKTSSY